MTSNAELIERAVSRTEKRLSRYHEGLRVKSFEVGDNPISDQLAADLRVLLDTITALEERIGVLNLLVEESLYHLRLDDRAKDYHNRVLAALNQSNDDYCGIVVVDEGGEDGE